jgi:hypothetical protein
MVKPIPDNVKEALKELTSAQQVTLRGYIGTLRAEMKELEEQLLTKSDPDPHAHYHGHEKCTSDHGHGDTEHKEHAHSHDHKETACTDGSCDSHDHSHSHEHKHKEHDHDHEHKHDHDHHEHKHHDHDHKEEKDEMPAWKKKALEQGVGSDPSAAPFGGNWTMESMVDAEKDKMEH